MMSEGSDYQNTVLIVDDDPYKCKGIEILLRDQGYNLVTAGNGLEALAKAAEVKPDVVLLDVMMPQMNGFEVCRRLRADPLQAEVPIILITTLDDHESRRKGLEAGADDFLSRPINKHDLRTRLRIITRLNRYRRLLAERVQRQQIEAELQKSQQQFETLVADMSDGFVVLDEHDCITYANQRLGDILGYPVNALIGRPALRVLDESQHPKVKEQLHQRREGSRQAYTMELTRPDGKQIIARASPTPIFDEQGVYRGASAVVADITEQAQMEQRLHQLAQKVISAQEDERRRLSRELHDEAGQALTALKISLDLIHVDLPVDCQALKGQLTQAADLADSTIERIRMLSQDLRPPALETIGLNRTMEGFCHNFAERTRLAVEYQGTDLPELPDTVNISLYRVLQESLTNVIKHAQADRVWVSLEYSQQFIQLEVIDNGQGFDVAAAAAGIGLLGMKERVELLNGQFKVESHLGQGTRILALIPWSEA